MSGDEEGEVEEGQLVATPGECSRTPSPDAGRNRKSKSPRIKYSTRVAPRKSRSKSPTKNRNRSRSRSVRRSKSHDGKRRPERRRSRSRSRSGSKESYRGPIIRDMRRGRGGRPFNRFNRGGPRGQYGRRDRFNDRYNRSKSRSKSRSGSPKRDNRRISPPKTGPVVHQQGKSMSPQLKGAQPSDIKSLSKAETSSFLAMLQQKKVNKLIPINIKSKNPENEGSHGFVSTFATVGQKKLHNESRGSSDDENENGTVVMRNPEMDIEGQIEEPTVEKGKEIASNGTRKRSRSRSSDQSDREKSKKKKSRKHKHKKKNKKRGKDDSDESEMDKQSKRKSGDGIDGKKEIGKSDGKERDEDEDKKKDKKRKRRRRHRSSSEESDRNKSKKKSRKSKRSRSDKRKKKKKRKSSSHSESDSSESDDGKVSKTKNSESKKKPDLSPKRKHKSPRTKDSEPQIPVAQTSVTAVRESKKNENVDSENKDDSFEFPRISKWTKALPSIEYCHNPRTLLMDPTTDILPKTKIVIPLEEEKVPKMKEQRDPKRKSGKSSSGDDPLTPSEKRSLEKKKKEEQQKMIKDEDKSNTASSSYYRPKKDSNKEECIKERESERVEKKEDKGVSGRMEEGSSSIRKSSKATEDDNYKKPHRESEDSIEEKKKKLLEKVREKKEVTKTEGNRSEKRMDISSMIGKIPKKKKSQVIDKNPVSMNSDYSYYQQTYIYNYGYDIYTAAYYAQYMMVTGGDYSQDEIKRWLESNGYKYDYSIGQEMPQLPPTDMGTQENTEQEAQPIGVVVPDVPVAAHEMYYQSPQSDSMDVDSEEEGGETPPPPLPPPPGPKITALTVTEPFSLPDGTSVPSGTKQVIVHPYSDTHPFASEFTPDAIKSKLQKQSNEESSNGFPI